MKASLTVVVALIVLLSMRFCIAADMPATEAWYVYVDGDVRFGSEHVVKRSLADGKEEYRVESRSLVDLLGTRQEETAQATYVVNSDLSPVSLHVVTKRPSGRVELTGAREGEHFVLRRESAELRRTSSIALQKGAIFRFLLPAYLSRSGGGKQTPDASVIAVPVIDEELLTVELANCRPVKSGIEQTKAWFVEIGRDEQVAKGRLTVKDGERFQEDFTVPRYAVRRSTQREAEQLSPLKLTGRKVLMFDVDRPIGRLDQLTGLTVRLGWKDLPLERFHLRDGRQTVVSHSVKEGLHEARIRIASPEPPDSKSAEVLKRDELEGLLGPSRFIDPTDAAIVAKALEWTKDCKNSRAAVIALSDHVFEHMSGGELISETLSGPEVLSCRKGKCSEYAVLFASLARAIKVPTRIVLGMRIVGGQWIGHMWNEVFLDEPEQAQPAGERRGHWVTVDATVKDVGAAPGLLKLTHSPKVLGTQSLRWDVTDSLEVSIVDFTGTTENPTEEWKTGVVDNSYRNGEFGFRVSAPGDGWKLAPEEKAGQVVMRLHVPGADQVLVHCVAVSLPVVLDAKTMLTLRSTRFRASYKEYTVLGDKTESINGRDWQMLQFTRAMGPQEAKQNPDGKLMKTTEFAFHQGKVAYLINLIAEESAHDKAIDNLRKIVKSLEFKPKPAKNEAPTTSK